MLISLLPNFVFQPLVFLLPVFISDVLKGSEGLGGLLLSLMGVGGVVATMLIASIGFKLGKGRSMIIGLIVGSAAILVMAQVPWLPVTMTMFLLLGFAQTHFRVGNSTLIQTLVPDELRGRVTSVYQLDHGLVPLAVFVISLVVQLTNVAYTLSVLAAGSLVISIASMIFAQNIRRLD
jgi:sugar phosphate permease